MHDIVAREKKWRNCCNMVVICRLLFPVSIYTPGLKSVDIRNKTSFNIEDYRLIANCSVFIIGKKIDDGFFKILKE